MGSYGLKGASMEARWASALERFTHQGHIIGKRAATSQNIGRAARARILFCKSSKI